jgi:hypothetical protein
VAFYTGAKALSRWPINDESTLTPSLLFALHPNEILYEAQSIYFSVNFVVNLRTQEWFKKFEENNGLKTVKNVKLIFESE